MVTASITFIQNLTLLKGLAKKKLITWNNKYTIRKFIKNNLLIIYINKIVDKKKKHTNLYRVMQILTPALIKILCNLCKLLRKKLFNLFNIFIFTIKNDILNIYYIIY